MPVSKKICISPSSVATCYIIHGKIFIQDNDSKHRSKSTREWMEEVGMIDNVMETPDINPLESLWSAKKKSKKKDNLVMGIRRFWGNNDHIHRAFSHVALNR